MLEILEGIDYNTFVLDNFSIEQFFNDISLDLEGFDWPAWDEIAKNELGVIELPYEASYVYNILERLMPEVPVTPIDI